MPCGVLEVHAATAVVVVDLAPMCTPWVGPMLQTPFEDAPVDGVEVFLGNQEG